MKTSNKIDEIKQCENKEINKLYIQINQDNTEIGQP